MPCYDPPRERPVTATEIARAVDEARVKFRHNSDVAQMLCEVMRYIERVTGSHASIALKEFSPELQQWWVEHQRRDAKR